MFDKNLISGLIRLHVLHQAAAGPLFGMGIMGDLQRHGYRVSGGTLYPLLHGLERKGYLASAEERIGRRVRRTYRTTPEGTEALRQAQAKLRELFGDELLRTGDGPDPQEPGGAPR